MYESFFFLGLKIEKNYNCINKRGDFKNVIDNNEIKKLNKKFNTLKEN